MNRSRPFIESILHSYSIVFFAKDKMLGLVLLIVSFFNPVAGLCGIISLLIVQLLATSMGFDKEWKSNGFYGFNALLTGLGLGSFFELSGQLVFIVACGSLCTFLLTIWFAGILSKYKLPFLSLPFVFTFWLLLLASREFNHLNLTERNIFWINRMVSTGGYSFFRVYTYIDQLPVPQYLGYYFRSLSAILFQENMLAGILIATALLIYSRIAFTLSIAGFFAAVVFNIGMGADETISGFYNMGANFMMASIAIGGFFTIPSAWSYLWSILMVPVTSLIVLAASAFMRPYQLPVYSLPFSIIVILFVFFISSRFKSKGLKLTPLQYFSPEINLYKFLNNGERLRDGIYLQLALPFWGEWIVSQGYNGSITHKGDWAQALDFIVLDNELKSWQQPGALVTDFYCYNKPVLAPLDGVVHEIVDNIEDNAVGKINAIRNWGNTIVLRHNGNVYTKLSHLRPGSFRVGKGEYVQKGQWIANSGSSGRSPEPHLHFQVQSTPDIGSRTLRYPLAYFMQRHHNGLRLHSYEIPDEGALVSNVVNVPILEEALRFQPGHRYTFTGIINNRKIEAETWEVHTDAYNQAYIRCDHTGSTAYFINNGTLFYFTHYDGGKNDLLYYFYLSAYKLLLGYYQDLEMTDYYPLYLEGNKLTNVVQDMIAPFYVFKKSVYRVKYFLSDQVNNPSLIVLHASKSTMTGKRETQELEFRLRFENLILSTFSVRGNNISVEARCTAG